MNEASAVALGYFDGVHLGHRAVVEAAVRAAMAHGWTPTAFTFTLPHGGAGKGAAILTPQEKCRRLRACGVERVIMPAFEEFCRLTPEEFVQNILVEQMHAAYVFTGDDFTFGAHKAGNVDLLHKLCESRGIRVITVPTLLQDGAPVSSTRIRAALENGDIALANALLGEPYSVTSPVTHGKQLGRTLGFPTINQQFASGMLVPRQGVYAGVVCLDGAWYAGATGLGTRPTVDVSGTVTCETFLPDFSGDAYEKEVRVYLLSYLWPTQRFDSLDELAAMIGRAAEKARQCAAQFLQTAPPGGASLSRAEKA